MTYNHKRSGVHFDHRCVEGWLGDCDKAEIYGHLSAGQRATDGALRDAQADLKLVLPIIDVMEEALRPCLPAGVQKRCQKPDFSGKFLFGDKLQQQMKDRGPSKHWGGGATRVARNSQRGK